MILLFHVGSLSGTQVVDVLVWSKLASGTCVALWWGWLESKAQLGLENVSLICVLQHGGLRVVVLLTSGLIERVFQKTNTESRKPLPI